MPPKWPHYLGLYLGFVSPFLCHRAIHRFLGIQSSTRTEISASFFWPPHSTEPLLQSTPLTKRNSSAGIKFYISDSPACQHRGMGQDKVSQVGQVLVKTDFPGYACYREKVRGKFIHPESGNIFSFAQPKHFVV